MKRLLVLCLGPRYVPTLLPIMKKYHFLSKVCEGDVVAVVDKKEFCSYSLEKFKLNGLYLQDSLRENTIVRDILYAIYTVIVSVYKHYLKKKYSIILVASPVVLGPIALIISKLTGAKVIVEVNGNFDAAFLFDSQDNSLLGNLKHKISRVMIPYVLKRADSIKLLYSGQISSFKECKDKPTFIFHDFVPISYCKPDVEVKSKYILFLGFPFYLKGVDILIKAFNKIHKDFPEYELKIVGHCPDREYFEKLAEENTQVKFYKAVWFKEALDYMSHCSLFVLPSRTEAMGKVLLEAMASKKPIIASNVDGIPTYVKHKKNGLLFTSESVEDLSSKMRKVLSESNYADKIAESGYEYVHIHLSEESYVNKFEFMIEQTINEK